MPAVLLGKHQGLLRGQSDCFTQRIRYRKALGQISVIGHRASQCLAYSDRLSDALDRLPCDLADVRPDDEIDMLAKKGKEPVYKAIATRGTGVLRNGPGYCPWAISRSRKFNEAARTFNSTSRAPSVGVGSSPICNPARLPGCRTLTARIVIFPW